MGEYLNIKDDVILKVRKIFYLNLTVSFLIYISAFFAFYFLQIKSFNSTNDNAILFGLVLLSVIIGGIITNKFNIIKGDDFERTLTKLAISFLINLIALFILLLVIKISLTVTEFLFGVMLIALVIESYYYMVLIEKRVSLTKFVVFKKISIKYFIIHFIILTFFCYTEVIANLIQPHFNKREILLLLIIYLGWLMSAFTTHKFNPTIVSENRWDGFVLQVKFYFRFIVLVVISLIFIQLDYSISIYYFKAIVGYTVVSSLISIFLFTDNIENRIEEAYVRFLKAFNIKDKKASSEVKKNDLRYRFVGVQTPEIVSMQQFQFEHVREYEKVLLILEHMLDLKSFDPRQAVIIDSDEPIDALLLQSEVFQLFVNLNVLNDQINMNNYLRQIRKTLVKSGVFVGTLHPYLYRYNSYIKKYSLWVGNLLYFFDFIWKRVFPKLPVTRQIYHKFRKEKEQAISLAEGLGRIVFTGYKLLDLAVVDSVVYFAAVKCEEPAPKKKLFYSPILKMERIGKDGKTIDVYKLRTMYPYSEFIQDFVYSINGSDDGDKITNDFRVPYWGTLFRKYWLDELPMLINLLKGDVKLVGVRPLSHSKFNIYPKDMQKLRTSTTPGLVPPFYTDIPTTFEELLESEKKYLLAYKKNPIKTDVEYFFKSFYNIFINKVRSS